MNITIAIIILTAIISFTAFSNQKIMDDLIFYPPAISRKNQWYRLITCGFIHADISHLLFNMISLYLFGDMVEQAFSVIFPGLAKAMYLVMYMAALFVCLLPTYVQHKDDYYYRSLGASGAVSAVVFAGIFLMPGVKIGLFILPPIIPGFIFGPLYLVITAYMSKKGGDGINHSAHLWGAVFGIVYLIVTSHFMSRFSPVQNFINEIQAYFR